MALRDLPTIEEFRGSLSRQSTGIRRSNPRHMLLHSDWPRPHARDRELAGMRLFVYGLGDSPFAPTKFLNFAVRAFAVLWDLYGKQDDCLVRYCDLGVDSTTANATAKEGTNLRIYTSEIPVLLRLLQVCELVSDPEKAHAFLVPVMAGTLGVFHWTAMTSKSSFGREALSNTALGTMLNRSLVHLNAATAPRHVFFQTLDSLYLGMRSSGKLIMPASSIVVHLGDDMWGATRE